MPQGDPRHDVQFDSGPGTVDLAAVGVSAYMSNCPARVHWPGCTDTVDEVSKGGTTSQFFTLNGAIIRRQVSTIGCPTAAFMLAAWMAGTPITLAAPVVVDLATDVDVAVFEGVVLSDSFGAGEIAPCDINGDALGDLLLTATNGDGVAQSRPNAGEAYVLLGARKRWSGVRSILEVASTRIIGEDVVDSLGSGAVCVDVNGDHRADMLLEAFNADSVGNSRDQAGQAHLIFGAPNLPALIDLAQPYGTVIYGAEPTDAVGDEPAAGDVNGDGTADLILDASHSKSRNGANAQAGKLHILFGRASWPASIDLRTGSSVTIFGATLNDNFAFELASADLNADGTSDVIADVPGGDGPMNARSSAGEIYLFRGRANWPATIDLATALPDSVIWGVDAQDQFGRAGLTAADLDADGTPELIAGGPFGDGPTETSANQGEIRTAVFGPTWPTTLDLRTQYRRVIYGIDPGDNYGNRLFTGDINGDGTADLISTSSFGDGPGNGRTSCGDTYVIFGAPSLGSDIRLANDQYDIIVYGADVEDRAGAGRFTSDINDDGLQEIVLRARTGVGVTRLARVYLISPFDTDSDGITQLADNCPLVANGSQLDSDNDGRGDACSLDWDGDGQLDTDDCAPNRSADGIPGEVTGVMLALGSPTQISWSATQFANRYDISRGALPGISSSNLGSCQNGNDPNRSDTFFTDPQIPQSGTGFFYLIRAVNARCQVAGTYGRSSSGATRVNSNPAGCP